MSKGVYAQEPDQVESEQSKQAEPEKSKPLSPFAVFTDVAVKEKGITVSILWPTQAELPDSTVLVSSDGQGNPTDKVQARPVAGEITEVSLPNSLQNPWETGWSQKLTLETSNGEVLAAQPYQITLLCEEDQKDAEDCGYDVYLSAEADPNVVPISSKLDQALTEIEREAPEGDLLDLVVKQYPELRGEAYVYADQIAKVTQKTDHCECHWEAVIERDPAFAYSLYQEGDEPATWIFGINGLGAAHRLAAWVGYDDSVQFTRTIQEQVSGTTEITLKVRCTKRVRVYPPNGQPYTIITSCPIECEVQFDHRGRYSGSANAFTSSGQNTLSNTAEARERGKYTVDGNLIINGDTGNDVENPIPFDKIVDSSIFNPSPPSSTAQLSTRGYAAAAAGPNLAAFAYARNSFGMAIYGQAACVSPEPEAVIWEVQSYEGRREDICESINDFFAQWLDEDQASALCE